MSPRLSCACQGESCLVIGVLQNSASWPKRIQSFPCAGAWFVYSLAMATPSQNPSLAQLLSGTPAKDIVAALKETGHHHEVLEIFEEEEKYSYLEDMELEDSQPQPRN